VASLFVREDEEPRERREVAAQRELLDELRGVSERLERLESRLDARD
jgi:hypothetical protein